MRIRFRYCSRLNHHKSKILTFQVFQQFSYKLSVKFLPLSLLLDLHPGQLSQAKSMWVHLHAAGTEILGNTATVQKGEEKLQ
jgi:hypothetical protein